ncbi:MAG: NAD(P)H-dependent oxidoreductase, partial [Desulfobacterales bacterium]|nr:NAD(P)H-dependent oxidoreductase [Desulfobacterales bacterium]
SPRTGDQSKTELMLNHLVRGMQDAGAGIEVVHLREKKIKNCIGCFTCWTKTPGKCIHKDDMTTELFPKWLAADLVVYATPLYFHTMNAAMSAFIERTLPVAQPFFEKNASGKIYHPLRNRLPPAVWLSVCGFPDESEFNALSDYLNNTLEGPVVAEIYRTTAERLAGDFPEEIINDVLNATEQAGRELVESMQVSAATMERIRQPLVDTDFFIRMGNLYWKTCINEGVTPKKFQEKKMIPRPESLEDFMIILPFGLNSEAAGDREMILQFNFSGDVNDSCYFTVRTGEVEAEQGSFPNPDITISTPFGLWMDIMTRKADGRQMFMEQKYTVSGDLEKMTQLFDKGE